MIFESHAHYDDPRFDEDRGTLLDSLKDAGISHVVNVGATIESSHRSIQLAEKYDFIYAAVGVHPHDVKDMKDKDIETLLAFTAHPKVVAIGEIGLDYYYDLSPREIQRLWFREQIELAKQIDIPIIYHSRDATKEMLEIMSESKAYDVGGVMHCFGGSLETARQLVDWGIYLGIGGTVTFKNAEKIKRVVEGISLDSMLLETDSPYLSPEPKRGRRNDSTHIPYIAEMIAKIKNVTKEEVIAKTSYNAKKLFELA